MQRGHFPLTTGFRRGVVALLAGMLLLAVIAFFGSSYLCSRYNGQIKKILADFAGQDIYIQNKVKNFGNIDFGQKLIVSYVISNLGPRPLRIVGSRTSCGCLTVSDLPMKVGPGEERCVKVVVRPPVAGPYEGVVILFTTAPSTHYVTLKLWGHVRPSSIAEVESGR